LHQFHHFQFLNAGNGWLERRMNDRGVKLDCPVPRWWLNGRRMTMPSPGLCLRGVKLDCPVPRPRRLAVNPAVACQVARLTIGVGVPDRPVQGPHMLSNKLRLQAATARGRPSPCRVSASRAD
jgi:hypothetical protein